MRHPPSPLTPRLTATLGFAVVTAAASHAEANHDVDLIVSPGFTFSISLGAPRFVWGFGLECSVLSPTRDAYVGGVAQAQYLSDGTFRVAASAQGSILVAGLELGVALRTSNAARSFTVSAHAAPFLSIGYAYASYDLNLTLNRTEGVRPVEHFMHFGLKAPLGRSYDYVTGGSRLNLYEPSFGGGRPLRHEGVACLAPLREGDRAWVTTPAPVAPVEDLEERARLARAWAHDAQLEHASVAAFARLSLELLALGAPPALVRGAHEAALDEIAHAELCLALASAYGGAALAPAALPAVVTSSRRPDLVTLAVEALVEGCLGEGVAAAHALEASRDAEGPARSALERIAADEAKHAELAWSVLAWCQREGGDAVREAVLAATRGLPEVPRRPFDVLAPAAQGRPGNGRLDERRARSLARQVTRHVVRRVALPRGAMRVVEAAS